MTRRSPNILIKRLLLKADWTENGEDCRMEVDLEGDTESMHELTAVIADRLWDMFGNE